MHPRLLRQNKIHFGARPIHLDSFHRATKILRQLSGINQAEERPLRIGVGEHGACGDLSSIFEHHTTQAAVPNINARHRSGSADLNAALACSRGERLGDCAHTANHVSIESL